MCVCVCVCVCIYIYIYMEVNNGKESESIEKIEKQSNPERINLLWRKANVKTFRFLMNLHQDFKMGKQVLIEQRWMF